MIKEIKYSLFLVIIFVFLFFTVKYYFSDDNRKKSYRSFINIENKINSYAENLPILENNTKDIIEYIDKTEIKKKKKYYFWELIGKND